MVKEGDQFTVDCSVWYGGPKTEETLAPHVPKITMTLNGQEVQGTEERVDGSPGVDYERHRVRMVSFCLNQSTKH